MVPKQRSSYAGNLDMPNKRQSISLKWKVKNSWLNELKLYAEVFKVRTCSEQCQKICYFFWKKSCPDLCQSKTLYRSTKSIIK